jgi:hypothetical protein
MMIRLASEQEFETIYEIINAAAMAYKGIIPADRSIAEVLEDTISTSGNLGSVGRWQMVREIHLKGEVLLDNGAKVSRTISAHR